MSEEEIERATASAQGSLVGYAVSETIIDAGTAVFVAGRIEDRDGALRIEPDPAFDEVVLFQGSQEAFVEQEVGSAGGLRIALWVFGAVVAPLPLGRDNGMLPSDRSQSRSPRPVG